METTPSIDVLTVSIDDADEDAMASITDGLIDLYGLSAGQAFAVAFSLVVEQKLRRDLWDDQDN